MHLQHSGCDKIFSALITKPKAKGFFSSAGLTRYTSGKLVLETIFDELTNILHTFLAVQPVAETALYLPLSLTH